MKICKPFKNYNESCVTQGFSDNHKSVDFTAPWGTFLVAPFNCKIVNIVDGGELGATNYIEGGCGIRMISIENPNVSMVYWHCNSIFPVEIGDIVQQGEVVAQMGNTGYVLSNGQYVPIDKRFIVPFLGTHCHCSMNINSSQAGGEVDFRNYIDPKIQVNYDLKTTIASFIIKISRLLK